MRVNVILLDYLRHDFTQEVKDKNLPNAGHPFDLITVDMEGISAAFNYGLSQSAGYDGVVFMANDILLPGGWLKQMVDAAMAIPQTGSVGIHCVEAITEMKELNGIKIHQVPVAYGSVLYPMNAIREVGGYNTEYDPYGMQDSDYAFRMSRKGFIHYYLHGLISNHIGSDVNSESEYRKMKWKGLETCGEKWYRLTTKYDETGDYTVNMPEWM